MADSKKDLICPACQTIMKKFFIDELNLNIDICVDGCGGIFFDNREFKHFDEQHENMQKIIEALENKTFVVPEEKGQRKCPACNALMVKNYSSIKKEIQVDDCYSCGGKFLDNTELQKIRDEYITDQARANDVIKHLYSSIGKELTEAEIAAENIEFSPGLKLVTQIIKKLN